MAMNMDAVLRIAAKVTGLQDLGALEKGLQGAEKAAGAAQSGFKAMVNSAAWQGAAAAATGLSVAIGLSVRAAMDFESSMAEVRKVVDGLESPAAFAEMKQEIIGLSRELPISIKGITEIYAAAGQSGIAKAELRDFAVMVGQVATAFDMTAAEAGRALAQLKVALDLSTEEVRSLADTMNYLSNNTGATAADLVDFMTRAGAAGKIAGLSGEQTAGFGAAMIQAGVNTEVAATSFNNMVKALSTGPSMTDRQVDALGRLGYAVVSAADEEQRLTFAVQAESDRRMEAYRRETDSLLKEIGRRYRNQLQQLQDGWDDEARAYERSLQRQADAQIKSIQASERMSDSAKDAAIDRIRDQMEDELTEYRRAQRDRQQIQRDRIDDEKQAEIDAANAKFKEVEKAEKQFLEQSKAAAKKTAEETANAFKQGFADRLQQDAIGTIMDVLGRIADLPKAQQMSVISDLFGDEARGLAPLIANLGELERVLAMSNDKTKAAGSVLKEFAARSDTTANSMQLLANRIDALQIAFGDTFLGSLDKLMKLGLGPLIDGLTWMIENIPGLGPAIGVLSTAFIGLVAVAPFITSLITLLGKLGITATGLKVIWAGLQTVFIVSFKGILSWLGSTFIPAILTFFSGPVGWTVLAIAAVVAMAIAFREPIGKFLVWLWDEFKKAMVALGNAMHDWIVKPLENLWNDAGELTKRSLGDMVRGVQDWWRDIQGIWGKVTQFFNTYVIRPVQQGWDSMVQALPRAMTAAVNLVRDAWRSVLQYIANQINTVAGLINRLISSYNALPAPDIPLIPTITVPAFAEGGYVRRPTLAMVGEGSQPEYIIPESKMAAASANYLAGSRGADVIPTATPSRSGTGAAPIINIRTGKVVEFDGQRYVSMQDFERGLRQVSEGVIGRLRTPAARAALGMR